MRKLSRHPRTESSARRPIHSRPRALAETLESRTLLSAAATPPAAITSAITSPIILTVITPVPVTIHPVAGVPFSGDVGMIRGLSRTLLPLLKATINWGDSTAASSSTVGQLSFDASGVLHVKGQHTYAKAGNYPVTVSVIQNPPAGSMAPSRLYTIKSQAIVTANSAGGVTIYPVPNKLFSGVVGTFTYTQPQASATNPLPNNMILSATVNWGDGKTSVGKIVQTSTGKYTVLGDHTYTAVGTFRIEILVTARPAPTATAPTPLYVLTVADILSTAVVKAVPPIA